MLVLLDSSLGVAYWDGRNTLINSKINKLEKYKIIWHLKEANLRKAVKTSQNNVNFLTAVFGTSSD